MMNETYRIELPKSIGELSNEAIKTTLPVYKKIGFIKKLMWNYLLGFKYREFKK